MLPMNRAALAFNRPLDHGKLVVNNAPNLGIEHSGHVAVLPAPAVGVFDLQTHHGSGSQIDRMAALGRGGQNQRPLQGGKGVARRHPEMAENAGEALPPELAL